jgi:hypothetical protein
MLNNASPLKSGRLILLVGCSVLVFDFNFESINNIQITFDKQNPHKQLLGSRTLQQKNADLKISIISNAVAVFLRSIFRWDYPAGLVSLKNVVKTAHTIPDYVVA